MAFRAKSTNLENVGRRTPTYSFLSSRSLMVHSTVSYTKKEETLEYTSPPILHHQARPLMVQSMGSKTKVLDLEKEMSVVSDMLERSFPSRRGSKPPTMEEETLIDCNQAAKFYGGVVRVSYPNGPPPKVVNKRPSGSKFY